MQNWRSAKKLVVAHVGENGPAENVIAALRQEREITDNVRTAVSHLREERRSEERPTKKSA
jgi:hypothetical protein